MAARVRRVLERHGVDVALLVVVVVAVAFAGAVLVLPRAGAPAASSVLLVGSGWAAVAAVAVGVARHRPQRRLPWLAFAGMLACWASAHTQAVTGALGPLRPGVLLVTGQVIGAALVAGLFARQRARGPARPRGGRWSRAGGRLDVVILLTTTALVLAQALALLLRDGAWEQAGRGATAGADVLLLALVTRFVLTRAYLPAATRLLVLGALLSLGYHLVEVSTLEPPGAGGPDAAVAVAAFCLLAGAALLPSMTCALDLRGHTARRPASAQLLGLVPVVVAAPLLWSVGSSLGVTGLPTGVFVCAGALVAALGMLRGVVALRASEWAAGHDELTGLPNRRGLAAAFDDRLRDPRGLVLCLVDLDDFKAVNDTHGHEVGDELLVAVGDTLRASAGRDAVVARLGGDEFVVLLRATPEAPPCGEPPGGPPRSVADATPARVLAALQRPVHVAGLELRTSASVGVVRVVAPSSLPQALTRADIAMYAAKAAGKDGVTTYRPRMRALVQRRQRLAEDLRLLLEGAPAARVGRLVPHHQPLVGLESGQVVGSEALVRWHHPHLGLLPPSDFLDVVREGGREVDLDALVLDATLAQVGSWRRLGLQPVPVSVNVTAATLLDGRLDVRVARALRRHDVPAGLLRLEITEHEQVPESVEVARMLDRLVRTGVRLSLDDFGVGYTSLTYLQRFPISLLKLDRSLVIASQDDLQLLTGIAAMARALDLDVLAEGVETPEQRERLVGLGIHYGQGFLFSPALTAEDLAALLPPSPRGARGSSPRAGGPVGDAAPPAQRGASPRQVAHRPVL
ncbi:putative bifunctional diguanylate cyclase/phosphodiesterase [Pseudokineococcus sp. 1T1Z-3]|uniref:putative bifunctional diguanylate cyclase/phosphodiesterase n=1 Tax=Pseudokineococcus sp. 1T1Z-3 TaxID=3132745 RepID=UPI0030AB0B7C